MASKRVTLKWRKVKGEWRAGPVRISDLGAHLVNGRFAVYAVTTGGKLYRRYMANFATFLHSEKAAKRACEPLAARIVGAMTNANR